MSHIWTLTMNPAIDIGAETERVTPNRKLRCQAPSIAAAGGGVNVSRALHRLGRNSTAVFPAGGDLGVFYETLLKEEPIEVDPFPAKSSAQRINTNYREEQSGDQYRFCMPGMDMAESEWRSALELLRIRLKDGDFLVISGSLPPGVPPAFIREAADVALENGVRTLLDTTGEVLRHLKDCPIAWVTPNKQEVESLMQQDLDLEEAEEVLGNFLARSAIRNILLTLGGEGAVYVGEDGAHRIPAPQVEKVSAVGAGDSSLAGLVHGLMSGESNPTSARWAVAAGSATVMTPGTRLLYAEDFQKLKADLREEPA